MSELGIIADGPVSRKEVGFNGRRDNKRVTILPSVATQSRSGSAAASNRTPISPPVCGVQPGQMLALRTTIGLIATMEEIKQRELQDDPPGTSISRGALKTGRLQPLRRVMVPPQAVGQCLGIIPVMTPRSAGERPRSSTIDPIEYSRRREQGMPAKRRSRSAIPVPSASFEPPTLLALVPQAGVSPPRASVEDHTLPSVLSVVNHFKMDVKIAKKQHDQLPPIIHNSTEAQSLTTAAAREALVAEEKGKVRIITLGNEVPEKPKSRGGHQSKRATSGKLSQGWSPPKPLGSISGTSVPITPSAGKRTQLHIVDRNSNEIQNTMSSEPVHVIMEQTLSEDPNVNPV